MESHIQNLYKADYRRSTMFIIMRQSLYPTPKKGFKKKADDKKKKRIKIKYSILMFLARNFLT